jgi:hypothetical protein
MAMPHVVVRLYTDSGPLAGKIRESEAEVREIMFGVPGFRAYSFVDTGSGALSITACDDKAGTDASVQRAAEWIKANLPDAKIAAPRIIEGEGMFRIEGKSDGPKPRVVVTIFHGPPPEGARESESDLREALSGVAGFRAYSAIHCGPKGVTVLVCDDQASIEACTPAILEIYQTMFPETDAKVRSGEYPAEVIAGDGAFRFTAQSVPA